MKATLVITTAILSLGLVTSQADATVGEQRVPCVNKNDVISTIINDGDAIRQLLPESEKASFTAQCQLLRKNPNYNPTSIKFYDKQEWLSTGDAYITDNTQVSNQIKDQFTISSAAHELSFDMNVYGKKEKNYKPINVHEQIRINCNGSVFNATINEDLTTFKLTGEYTANDDSAFMNLNDTETKKLKGLIKDSTIKPMKFAGLPSVIDENGNLKFDKKEIENFLQKYELALVSRANQGNDPNDSRLYITKCSKAPTVNYEYETVDINCDPKKDMSGGVLVYVKRTANGIGEILKDKDGHVLVAGHLSGGSEKRKVSTSILIGIGNVVKIISPIELATSLQ